MGDPAHNGVVKFAGTNTYAGPTTVSNGTLVVNGINGASPVTVTAGTILGGSGTIGGAVTVNSGGHTLPGGTQGNASGVVLTLSSNATYNAGGEADFNLSGTYNSGNDQLVVTNGGTVNGNGQNVGVYLTAGSADTTGDYVLITNVSGSLASSFARVPVWLGATPGNAANYSILTSGKSVVLHYSPIIIASGSALPSPAIHGQHVTVSVNVTSTAGTISSVSLNAGAIGGSSSLTLTEVGATSVYTGNVVVSSTTPVGVQTLLVTAKDSGGNTNTVPVLLTIVGTGEVWTGNASPNNTWAAGGNWVSGAGPGPGDWVTFAGTQQLTANMESSYSLAWLTFDVTAGAFTITNAANTLTLTGSVTNNSANVETLGVPVVLGGVETINAAAGSIVMNTNVSGAGGLIYAGTNALTLAGSNTYSGPTTISAGALTIAGPAAQLGGGAYAQPITDNGVLNYNSAAAQTLSGIISGGGTVTQNGPGTLALTAANTYTNNTTINNGVVAVQNSASFGPGNVVINGGGIMFATNGFAGYSLANAFFFTNTSIIDMNHSTNSESMYGAWSGTGTVIISNLDWVVPGENLQTLTIGGNTATATMNAFTGKLVVAPMNSDGLVSQGSLRFNSGGTSYNTGNTNASFNLGTNVNDAVSLTSRDAGVINLGELIGGPSTVLLGSRSTATPTYWSVGGLNTSTTFAGSVSNFSTTNISALIKVGTGTLTLTGTNTDAGNALMGPTGPILISAGTLQIGDGGADGTLTSGNVTNNAALVFDRSDSYTVTNVISGTGVVTNLGTGTLTLGTVGGVNAYSGGTIVSAGTLVVAKGVSSGTGTGAVNVNGGTLLVNGAVGTAAVTVNSGGTLGGSGTIAGAVATASGGNLAPGAGTGAAGTVLTINNGLTMSPGGISTLAVSHNNHTNDQVVGVAIVYGGTLNVTTIAGDAPLASGDTFQLFKANSSAFYSGSFSATNLPALSPGLVWSNSLGAGGNGTITVTGTVVSQQPVTISGGAISGGMFVISGTNGVPGAQYRILETTNAALAITNWTPVWTNVFGAGGSFSYTNTPGVNPAGFFLLVSP